MNKKIIIWVILICIVLFCVLSIIPYKTKIDINEQIIKKLEDQSFNVEIGAYIYNLNNTLDEYEYMDKSLYNDAKQNIISAESYLNSDQYILSLLDIRRANFDIQLGILKLQKDYPKFYELFNEYQNLVGDSPIDPDYCGSCNMFIPMHRLEWEVFSKYWRSLAFGNLNKSKQFMEEGEISKVIERLAWVVSDLNLMSISETLSKKRGAKSEMALQESNLYPLLVDKINENKDKFNHKLNKENLTKSDIPPCIEQEIDLDLDIIYNTYPGLSSLFYSELLLSHIRVLDEFNGYKDYDPKQLKQKLGEEINISENYFKNKQEQTSDFVFPYLMLHKSIYLFENGQINEDFLLGLSYAKQSRDFLDSLISILQKEEEVRGIDFVYPFEVNYNCGSLDTCEITYSGKIQNNEEETTFNWGFVTLDNTDFCSFYFNKEDVTPKINIGEVQLQSLKLKNMTNTFLIKCNQKIYFIIRTLFFDISNPLGEYAYPFDSYRFELKPANSFETKMQIKVDIPNKYFLDSSSGIYWSLPYFLPDSEIKDIKLKNFETFDEDNKIYYLLEKMYRYSGKRLVVQINHSDASMKITFILFLILFFLFGIFKTKKYSLVYKPKFEKISINHLSIIFDSVLLIVITLIQIFSLNTPLFSLMFFSPFIGLGLGWLYQR